MKHFLTWCLLIVVFFMFPACGRKKQHRLEAPKPLETIKADSTTLVRPPPIKPLPPIAMQVAGLQQTGCYGKCPVFEYKIFDDGRVTYIGRKHVERLGVFEARLSHDLVSQIIAYADLVGFFQMPDLYPDTARDIVELPSTVSFIKKDGVGKSVINRYDAPKGLAEFESFFLNIMNSLEWELIR